MARLGSPNYPKAGADGCGAALASLGWGHGMPSKRIAIERLSYRR
jgi:hypothetical protein